MWKSFWELVGVILTLVLMCLAIGLLIWLPYNYIAPVEAQLTYLQVVSGVWLFVMLRKLVLTGLER